MPMKIERRGIVLGLLVGIVLTRTAGAGQEDARRGLDIFFIDVQGGAATLLVTPERESILVDSGWPGLEDRDPRRIVQVLKERARCDHLDHMITTHWHMDHFGGVAGLARLVEIKHYWDRGLPEDGDATLDFPDGPKVDDPLGIAYRQASRGKRTALKAGDPLSFRGGLTGVVLSSGGKVLPAPSEATPNPLCAQAPADLPVDPSDNARSLSLRFRFGKFDFLDCGDLTWNVEKALVCPNDLIGPIDLYQVTHHGLDISNHPTLLRTIQPIVTIMNNGPRKGGAAATVKLLRSIPSIQAAYQLHHNAETSAEENTEAALIANAEPSGGQYIHVSVSPDGSKFAIRIGDAERKREFASK
jgi:competence protein ComEC